MICEFSDENSDDRYCQFFYFSLVTCCLSNHDLIGRFCRLLSPLTEPSLVTLCIWPDIMGSLVLSHRKILVVRALGRIFSHFEPSMNRHILSFLV